MQGQITWSVPELLLVSSLAFTSTKTRSYIPIHHLPLVREVVIAQLLASFYQTLGMLVS